MAQVRREVVIGQRGRLVLPAAIRAELGLESGTRMLASTEPDGSLRLRPFAAVAEQGRGLLAELAPADESLVDELIAERRAEASCESVE